MGLMFRRRRPVARLAAQAAAAGLDGRGTQPPVYLAPSPASTGGEVDELARIVHMHETGALTQAEFTAAKAQLLRT